MNIEIYCIDCKQYFELENSYIENNWLYCPNCKSQNYTIKKKQKPKIKERKSNYSIILENVIANYQKDIKFLFKYIDFPLRQYKGIEQEHKQYEHIKNKYKSLK